MGLSEDVVSREGIIASMEDVALKQCLFLRNLAEPVTARFGERGMTALDNAFRHYGQWRGETIRMSQASLVAGHDALAFLANWDSCDFVLASLAGEVAVEGGPAKATLRLPQMPGTAYFKTHHGGPELLHEGVRGIGRERGSVLRDRHIREGKALNLKSLMLDWDGPLVSTWVFNEGYLSEGAWHQDCRYCPYADVWAEFGKQGLDLGLLYDIELHTTMYQTYHPGTIVRWDALKTRGDHLCKFRISIPELASPNDPEYAAPKAP